MRIISPFRDYYDFIGKIYRDEDPRAYVWERRTAKFEYGRSPAGYRQYRYNEYRLLLADQVLIFFEHQEQLGLYSFQEGFKHSSKSTHYKTGTKTLLQRTSTAQTALQMKHATPVILLEPNHYTVNPKLLNYNIHKVFPEPGLIYQDFERWFTDGKFSVEIPSKLTDKQKTVSHGFDLKTSFRNPIK